MATTSCGKETAAGREFRNSGIRKPAGKRNIKLILAGREETEPDLGETTGTTGETTPGDYAAENTEI